MTGVRTATAAILAGTLMAAGTAAAQDLVYSGVSTTSDDYALGVLWSNLLVESGSEIEMTVVENGSVAGMRKAAQAEVDIVGVGAPHYLDAVNGTGRFQDDPEAFAEAYADMRLILSIPTGAAQYVARADGDVHGFADFDGRSIGIGRPGGNAGRVSTILFGIHGLEDGAVDGQHLEYGPALEQIATGTLDATLVWGGLPDPAIDNASRNMQLRFVSPDPETLPAFRDAVTNGQYYVYREIPAAAIERAYEGRVEAAGPAYFWTFPFQIVVRGEIGDDTVYEITRVLWENIDQIHAQSAALSLIGLETALTAVSAELHPGAARYYREIGLIQ